MICSSVPSLDLNLLPVHPNMGRQVLLARSKASQTLSREAPCLPTVLAISLALNVAIGGMVWVHMTGEGNQDPPMEAAVSCSGHGAAFVDGGDGREIECECFGCFTGPDCSRLSTDACVADADSGDPLFMEPFWRKYAASSAVVIPGWHRMSYVLKNNSVISRELEEQIRKLHTLVGNANAKGKYIVFGSGSTQLLNAAVHALSSLMLPNDSSKPSRVKVVATFPFYPIYKLQTDHFESNRYKFEGEAMSWKNSSDPSDKFIEFVTSPNNPDGEMKKAVLKGPSVRTIYDHAYYWPHYTSITSPSDQSLMIFSLSKLTGHAGSRFGWALLKDKEVYVKMMEYVNLNVASVSYDTQLRALKILKVAVEEDNGREIFEFAHATMKKRWQRLGKALSAGPRRFSLQHLQPRFCTFSQRIRHPSPAYAWLKCNREEDKDCYSTLKSAGIIGREGSFFGGVDGNRHVRLSLIKSQDDFEILVEKLNKLISTSVVNVIE